MMMFLFIFISLTLIGWLEAYLVFKAQKEALANKIAHQKWQDNKWKKDDTK